MNRCQARTHSAYSNIDITGKKEEGVDHRNCSAEALNGNTLCYYHDKMAAGLITPHYEWVTKVTTRDTGEVLYEPNFFTDYLLAPNLVRFVKKSNALYGQQKTYSLGVQPGRAAAGKAQQLLERLGGFGE